MNDVVRNLLKKIGIPRDSCIFIAIISIMRSDKIVADDIDPRQTSIEAVERVITGEAMIAAVERVN